MASHADRCLGPSRDATQWIRCVIAARSARVRGWWRMRKSRREAAGLVVMQVAGEHTCSRGAGRGQALRRKRVSDQGRPGRPPHLRHCPQRRPRQHTGFTLVDGISHHDCYHARVLSQVRSMDCAIVEAACFGRLAFADDAQKRSRPRLAREHRAGQSAARGIAISAAISATCARRACTGCRRSSAC